MREESWNLNQWRRKEQILVSCCVPWVSEAGWALTAFLPLPWCTEICNFSLTRGNWRIKTQTCLVSLAHPEMLRDATQSRQWLPGSTWAQPVSLRPSWLDLGSPDLGKYYRRESDKQKPKRRSRKKVKNFSIDPMFCIIPNLVYQTLQYSHKTYQTATTFSEIIIF